MVPGQMIAIKAAALDMRDQLKPLLVKLRYIQSASIEMIEDAELELTY